MAFVYQNVYTYVYMCTCTSTKTETLFLMHKCETICWYVSVKQLVDTCAFYCFFFCHAWYLIMRGFCYSLDKVEASRALSSKLPKMCFLVLINWLILYQCHHSTHNLQSQGMRLQRQNCAWSLWDDTPLCKVLIATPQSSLLINVMFVKCFYVVKICVFSLSRHNTW